MDYSKYDIEDFASDESFIKWVLDHDPEAERVWEVYKRQNPGMQFKVDAARTLVLNLHKVEQPGDTSLRVKNVWQHIEAGIAEEPPVKRPRLPYALKIAASVSVIAIVLAGAWYKIKGGGFFSDVPAEQHVQAGEFIEEVNTTGSIVRIHLSDGSVVSLEDNSRLKYPKDFTVAQYRQVYLTGEAFFEIAKNPQQPFLVCTNEIVTKVLGTSFRVKAYDHEKNILVSVKEGKVSVYSAKDQKQKAQNTIDSEVNGVVLTPNQQVVYTRTDDSFNKTLISTPEILKDRTVQYDFAFVNTPVDKVFSVLEEAYGVEIIFNEDIMKDCYLTAPLGDEPLFQKLKIICRTIGATYELIDTKVVISGRGCAESQP